MALEKSRSRSNGEAGFSLAEVMVALGLLATALITLANLFGLSTRGNLSARNTTYASVLAEQKLEELRALTWGFDENGLPISDRITNTAVSPEEPNGGKGLEPSPLTALQENTDGYVDYVDQWGNKVGRGGMTPPQGAIYTRRWSVTPLPTNPNNTLILQVLVTPLGNDAARQASPMSARSRLPGDALLVSVKTRKSI